MSLRIRDEVEKNSKEFLLDKYVDGFKRNGLSEKFDSWLDFFVFSCITSYGDENDGKLANLDNLYELNVKPISVKTGVDVSKSDYYGALDRLVSRGEIDVKDDPSSKKAQHSWEIGESSENYSAVSTDAYNKALGAITGSGLGYAEGEYVIIKKSAYRIIDALIKIMEDNVGDVIKKCGVSQAPLIEAEEISEGIIDSYIKTYGVGVDEDVLRGLLGYASNWTTAKIHKKYRNGEVEFDVPEQMIDVVLQMKSYAMISEYSVEKRPDFIDIDRTREGLEDILRQLDETEPIDTTVDSNQILFFLAKQYERSNGHTAQAPPSGNA